MRVKQEMDYYKNAVFIKLDIRLECSGTQQILDTAALAAQNKADIDVLQGLVRDLRHDVDNHENRLPPK